MNRDTEFATLTALHSIARLLSEGGRPVVLLPRFSFQAAGKDAQMDLLLVPWEHSGYVTRLFYERAIPERVQNWSQHVVLSRNWWAPSWNHVPATYPWREILLAHLRAVA